MPPSTGRSSLLPTAALALPFPSLLACLLATLEASTITSSHNELAAQLLSQFERTFQWAIWSVFASRFLFSLIHFLCCFFRCCCPCSCWLWQINLICINNINMFISHLMNVASFGAGNGWCGQWWNQGAHHSLFFLLIKRWSLWQI